MAYFPNGSSGDVFDEQCADCPLGYGWNDPRQGSLFENEREPKPCPVALVQLEFNYKQVGNKDLERAMSVLVKDNGECQVREQLLECRREEAL